MAQSIAEYGVLQPITVRKAEDRYVIVMRERRYRASKLAGLTTISAMVRNYVDTEVLEVQIIENLQRKDVEPTEEADAILDRLVNTAHRIDIKGESMRRKLKNKN